MTGQSRDVLALTLVLMLCPAATVQGGELDQWLLGDANRGVVEVAPVGAAEAEIVRVSQRTIVGSSDGWRPLEEIDDVSDQTKRDLTNAAADYYCLQSNGNIRTASAWFLNGDEVHFYTAAHAIAEYGRISKIDDCHLHLWSDPEFRQVYAVSRDASKFDIPFNIGNIPNVIPLTEDRVRIPISYKSTGAVPLRMGWIYGEHVPLLLVVSGAPENHRGLLAQHCTLKKKFRGSVGEPGVILTDCSHFDGASGGLYLAKDPMSCKLVKGITVCDWKPVAMHSRARQGLPDFSHWNETLNTAMGVRMDEPEFFDFSPSP